MAEPSTHITLQPSREEIVSDAIKIVRRIREHIDTDQCKCCRDAMEDLMYLQQNLGMKKNSVATIGGANT